MSYIGSNYHFFELERRADLYKALFLKTDKELAALRRDTDSQLQTINSLREEIIGLKMKQSRDANYQEKINKNKRK